MVQTTIESVDTTGREVTPDPELGRRVARGAAVLEARLASLTRFVVENRWRIVHQPGSAPRVELELTDNGVGVRDWVFDTKDWGDDDKIRRSLYDPIWAFADALEARQREESERVRRDLEAMAPITEE